MNTNGARASGKLTREQLSVRRKRLYILHGRGVFNMVDNTPAKAHIRYLMQYMQPTEIAKRAGLPVGTLSIHTYDYKGKGGANQIQRETLAAILSVKPDPGQLTYEQRALGIARMIGGLKARGYTIRYLSTLLDVSHNTLSRYQRTHRKVTQEFYNMVLTIAMVLEREDPAQHCDPRQVLSMRTQARRKRIPPIGAWDLDTIHLAESTPDPKWRRYK